MTRIYLIHGWGGTPSSEGWFGWLMKECKKRDIELIIPEMPNTDYPKVDEWVGKLKEIVKFDEDVYFIGHSIGAQAIMRYLEGVSEDVKVKGLVFVAGWMKIDEEILLEEGEEELEIAKPWMEAPIDFDKIKNVAGKVLCLFSPNDPFKTLSNADLFKEKLNAEIVVKENEGHFNETQEIKEIMEFVDRK